MAVRSTMDGLITLVRQMVADPAGASQQFSDQDYQDRLDEGRNDVRYLPLTVGPSIVNTASTSNIAEVIFADYYSDGFRWWETDVVLQGYSNGAYWIVLTPTTSDYITGHFTFESNVFTTGTAPGQFPPLFITGKVYDPNSAAADLLEFWAASLAGNFAFSADGQSFHPEMVMAGKLKMADYYRRRAKPRMAKMIRTDVAYAGENTHDMDLLKGVY
jgi:hypothetical protein